MTKEEVLQQCTVSENVVKLPEGHLDRKVYLEVKKSLELIGGKWKGGKVFGFVFSSDPTELLSNVANGENRNLKKEFQFFATPDKLADYLVLLANIKKTDIILEPQAGQGAIVQAIKRAGYDSLIFCCELMEANKLILQDIKNVDIICDDFLKLHKATNIFDKIIANPPFSKNQDIDHIRKMYIHLDEGGRMVSVASKHWVNSNRKKETEFKDWLIEVGAEVKDVPEGTFKKSGTLVGAKIIIINK